MLSVEEQSSVQARNFKKETLAQIMNVRDGDMKTFRENSAMEVLTALRSYVAISKCDELRSNREIAEYNKGNLFFMDEEKVDNNLRNMRNLAIRKLFEEKIFNMQIFDNVFKSCSLHMIAALGCPAEVPADSEKKDAWEESRESRLTRYAEEHGWNE